MSRNTGTFNFAANFEVLAKAPLDAKQLVETKADLTGTTTWNQSGDVWLYDGAIVSVGSDPIPENNGIYWLSAATNYTNINSWIKAGSGEGTGTITGGTNGLSTSGANIILGGNLTGDTTINVNSHEFQITTSGLTPSLIGIDPLGILISTSGSSVSMDTNEGLIYGSGYTSSNPNWIPTKLYVDGVAIGLNVEDAVFLATTGASITLSGNQIIDGILTTTGMRVLVKDQSNGALNGIYSANTGAWGRTEDYNFTIPSGITNGDLIPVTSGATQFNSLWAQTAQNPITSGDTLTFTLFSKPNVYIGGTGININTNTINIDGENLTGNSLKWTGNTFNVDITGGTLNTALNSKLNIIDFNIYSGDTQPVIDGAITGATNGLNVIGRNIEFGGILTDETIISGDSYNLCFGDVGSQLNQFSVCATNSIFNVECFLSNASTCVDINGGNFNVNLNNSGGIITDNRTGSTQVGLEYGSDYSANYTCLSIPNAGWVSGTSAINAINGLSNVGQNICLGGVLIQDTTICGAYILNLGNTTSGLTALCGVTSEFHIEDSGANSSICFAHDPDTPHFDVCLYGDNADSCAGIILDVDVINGYFNAYTAPNLTCCSSICLQTTDNNEAIFDVHSTNSAMKYVNETWISSACTMTCEALIDSGNDALNIKSVMDYSGRSFVFSTDNTTILSILSGGTARYGSNVTLTNDCDLAHKYYVDNATGTISASNGLTRVDDNITLGGILTGDTTISGGSHNLTLGTIANQLSSLQGWAGIGGFNLFSIDSSSNTYGIGNGIACGGCMVGLTLMTSGATTNGVYLVDNGNLIIGDNINSKGIIYGGDYENNFTARSLVTAQYVTGITSGITGAITTANNGLTKVGQNVVLGGTLTGNTTISGGGTRNLSLSNISGFSTTSVTNSMCATTSMLLRTPSFTFHNGINDVITLTTTCNKFSDSVNNEGFVYASNYCGVGKINPRWIPDNAYVTGLTSNYISTANNGLTKVGQNVVLGGALTGNTCISGSGTYSLCIRNSGATTCTVAEFNPTNINICARNVVSPNQTSKLIASVSGTMMCHGFANCYSCLNMLNSLVDLTICGGASNAQIRVTDNTSTPRGIEYAADYSSTFNDESLVTKRYVHNIASGLNVHSAVGIATTISDGNISLSGISGTIDDIAISAITSTNNRILVKNQTSGQFNGIYSASTGVWGRTEDYNFLPDDEISNGDLIPVLSGTTNGNSQWILVSPNPIVSGDTLEFSLFSQQQHIIEGDGIRVTTTGSTANREIAVKLSPSNSGLCFNATALEIDYNIFTSGLTTAVAGEVQVCANATPAIGDEIPVRFGTGGVLVVDNADFSYTTASNGLTKVGQNVVLGGTLTGSTIIDLNNNELNFYNENVVFDIGTGFDTSVYSIALQSDNKILVGGNFNTYSGVTSKKIIRLNSDGSIDNTFDSGTGFNSTVWTTTLQDDDKILIGGNFITYSGITANKIIRLNSDGSIDNTFDSGTGFDSNVYSIALQSDNKILVGGLFSTYSGVTANKIIRLNSDGSIDNTFDSGTGFDTNVYSVVLQSDNKILVGGLFSTYSGVTSNYIIRLNSDGSIDNTFDIGTGFNNNVYSVVLQSDNKILVGGNFTTYSGVTSNYIIRLNSDGSIDDTFDSGTGFNSNVRLITFQGDKILVGGTFTTYSGVTSNYIINLNSDGSIVNKLINYEITFNGKVIEYADNYYTDYTNRSLVDKEYVDNISLNTVGVCNVLTNYTATTTSDFIGVSGASIIFLPSTPKPCQRIIVADICGDGLNNNICIIGNGLCINGNDCATINTDFGSMTFINNGYSWSAVAFAN